MYAMYILFCSLNRQQLTLRYLILDMQSSQVHSIVENA